MSQWYNSGLKFRKPIKQRVELKEMQASHKRIDKKFGVSSIKILFKTLKLKGIVGRECNWRGVGVPGLSSGVLQYLEGLVK